MPLRYGFSDAPEEIAHFSQPIKALAVTKKFAWIIGKPYLRD